VAGTSNIFEYAFDVMLQEAGLTLDDVEMVEIRDNPSRLEALNQGSIDISVMGEPWVTRVEKAGAGSVWVPYADIIPNYPVGTILYGPSFLEDDPQAGVRFMVAYLKAVRQFDEGKTERNIEIISKYTKMTPEELNEICWTSFQVDGSIDVETLDAFIQWAADKKYLNGTLDSSQIWDPQFIEAANDQLN
jgi:NitT/TauT family transport system substrate-binding protein